jgi:hypothetical protein
MPYSSGTFSIVNSFTPSTTILSSAVNANFTDIATGLTSVLTLDGANTMTGQVKAADGSVSAPGVSFGADLNTGFYRAGSDEIRAATGGTDAMKWDSAQATTAMGLLVGSTQIVAGHTAALSLTSPGAFTPAVQAIGGASAVHMAARFSGDVNPARFYMAKSRNASIGSHTIVQSGDLLGEILVQGSDGDSFESAATIGIIVDGTPGAADMPGTLVFSTSADGSATPTERMAIRASGKVQIPNHSAPLITFDSTGFTDLAEISAPSSPAADTARVYAKDDSGTTRLAYKDSGGTETILRPPGVAGGAGLVLLNSGTLSNNATLDIVLTSYTAYRALKFMLTGIRPQTDGASLYMRTSTDGGSNYDAGASDYGWGYNYIEDDGGDINAVGDSADTEIELVNSVQGLGNAAGESYNGEITLYNQAGSLTKLIKFESYSMTAAGFVQRQDGIATRAATTDIDAVRFLASSGNLASGSWAVYGYA